LAAFLYVYSQVLLQALCAIFFLSDSICADGFYHHIVSAMKKPLPRIFFAINVSVSFAAVAQMLPQFGTARFGQAIFGQASAAALPVPFMPLWATTALALALWIVACFILHKED